MGPSAGSTNRLQSDSYLLIDKTGIYDCVITDSLYEDTDKKWKNKRIRIVNQKDGLILFAKKN